MAETGAAGQALELARAYGHLRWAFLPADPRAYGLLTSVEAAAQLRALAPLLKGAGAPEVEAFAGLANEFPSAASLKEGYEVCFRGARLVSPFETDYTTSTPFEQANELADISGFYRAFSLDWQSATVDRVDHIGSELEFLCVVSWMEAKAVEAGRLEEARIAGSAHSKFLVDHAGRWAGRLAARCRNKRAPRAFQAAASLSAAVVAHDLSSRGLVAKSISAAALPMA